MRTPFKTCLITGGSALAFASLGQAQITFQPGTSVATGLNPDTAALGDFDGDGDRDIAVTTGATGGMDWVEIYLNSGAGSFTPGQAILLGTNSGASGIVAADFDGDGDMDLATTQHNQNNVLMLVNAGNATFTLGSTASTGADPRKIAAGDVDFDGDTDVVTSNRDGNSISVVLNNGGSWGTVNTVAAGNDLREVALGDFNGDQRADIAVSAHDDRNVNVFMSLGGGAVSGPTSLSVGTALRPEGVVIADLDGDTDMDIAASTDDNDPSLATVFLNLGGGSFGPAATYLMGGLEPGTIVAADFDVDGDADLATANKTSGDVSTIQNNGNGTFAGTATFGAGTTTESLATADLDGNGSADLVAVNRDSNNMTVLLNTLSDGGGTTNYCVGSPNSAGAGATMGSSGSLSIGANTFTLTASGAIAGQPGLFYYGSTQAQIPFGEGFRCVTGAAFRLNPPSPADGSGSASRLVDFTSAPAGSGPGQITAGSTWHFQYWYRDPAGGGSNFNLSDGLTATFLP